MNTVAAYIGLGSNLAEPAKQLDIAIAKLDACDEIEIRRISSYYRNPAMLSDKNTIPQPDYINAVLHLRTTQPPHTLLQTLMTIETQQGRVRTEKHWEARVIDLDLLLYGDVRIQTNDLQVPHPGLPLRAFVLYPLYEIAGNLLIPGMGYLADMLKQHNNQTLQKLNSHEEQISRLHRD